MMGAATQLGSLIKMANQIADNVPVDLNEIERIDATANHVQRFWARSMKRQIVDYVRRDGSELSQIAQSAIRQLGDF